MLKISGVYLIGNPEICQDPPSCGQDDQTLSLKTLFTYCNHQIKSKQSLNCSMSLLKKIFSDTKYCTALWYSLLETVQDFLIKLDIKPLIYLLEISIFSLDNDLVRLIKIMNNLVKVLKILRFKVIFKHLKLVKSFQTNYTNETF